MMKITDLLQILQPTSIVVSNDDPAEVVKKPPFK